MHNWTCTFRNNYSLVPNEMMACGLPVVDIDAEHTRLSYEAETAVLAKATPVGLASALSRLLNDNLFRENRAKSGLEKTKNLQWDNSNKIIEKFIQESLKFAPNSSQPTGPSKPLVTIVIPVYNGGAMLKTVVESCLQQNLNQEFEVLLIDSSSNDGFIEKLPQDKRIRLHKINKEDFGHGRTRNLGVKLSRSEYVAFYAGRDPREPNVADESNRPTSARPQCGRVFGCHIAHIDHGHSPPTTLTSTSTAGFIETHQTNPTGYQSPK